MAVGFRRRPVVRTPLPPFNYGPAGWRSDRQEQSSPVFDSPPTPPLEFYTPRFRGALAAGRRLWLRRPLPPSAPLRTAQRSRFRWPGGFSSRSGDGLLWPGPPFRPRPRRPPLTPTGHRRRRPPKPPPSLRRRLRLPPLRLPPPKIPVLNRHRRRQLLGPRRPRIRRSRRGWVLGPLARRFRLLQGMDLGREGTERLRRRWRRHRRMRFRPLRFLPTRRLGTTRLRSSLPLSPAGLYVRRRLLRIRVGLHRVLTRRGHWRRRFWPKASLRFLGRFAGSLPVGPVRPLRRLRADLVLHPYGRGWPRRRPLWSRLLVLPDGWGRLRHPGRLQHHQLSLRRRRRRPLRRGRRRPQSFEFSRFRRSNRRPRSGLRSPRLRRRLGVFSKFSLRRRLRPTAHPLHPLRPSAVLRRPVVLGCRLGSGPA